MHQHTQRKKDAPSLRKASLPQPLSPEERLAFELCVSADLVPLEEDVAAG